MTDLVDEIRESWAWTGIDPAQVIAENEFGNLIVKDSQGQYWRLCPEDVYCKVVASTEADYKALINDPEFVGDWAMAALVEAARSALGELTSGRKYHLVIPGPLGGEYDVSNIRTVPLIEMIRFSGDLGLQIRDLPDGQQIEFKVID